MLDKLAAAGTVLSSVASGVSLLRSINTPMPKMPEIDYEGHNIAAVSYTHLPLPTNREE